MLKRYFCSWLVAAALSGAAGTASAKSASGRQVHVVYEGQRLGSIAKRYNVSIEAICEANGISRRNPIHPGQRLEIPSRDELAKKAKANETPKNETAQKDQSASAPEAVAPSVAPAPERKPAASTPVSLAKAVPVQVEPSKPAPKPVQATAEPAMDPAASAALFTGLSHRVEPGDSLIAIARKYDTTVKTLLQVNKLRRDQVIRVGQVLVVPRPAANSSWVRYARTPARPGEMEVFTLGHRWKGKVVVNGKVQSSGRAALSGLLGVTASAPPMPERLIQLLAHVSDAFGGRPVRLVSGYRTNSYFKDSRHKHSSAVDFSIEGVPNSAVRDYLLQLNNVGVGYYPNSSFVHLDVRGRSAYWVDYAGPGEAPRRKPSGDTRVAANGKATKGKAIHGRASQRSSATSGARASAVQTSTATQPVRRKTRAEAAALRELETLAEQAVRSIESTSSEPVTQTSVSRRKDRGG